jgi:hypothetical protein
MKWKNALYDTLSLIVLDGVFERKSGVAGRLPGILAVEESFLPCYMRADIALRMRSRSEVLRLPGPQIVSTILRQTRLPASVAEIDTLVFAAAVHYQVAVVTSDERLEEVLRAARVAVNHIAVFLHEPARLKSRAR